MAHFLVFWYLRVCLSGLESVSAFWLVVLSWGQLLAAGGEYEQLAAYLTLLVFGFQTSTKPHELDAEWARSRCVICRKFETEKAFIRITKALTNLHSSLAHL